MFTYAFQPIIDARTQKVFSYEALLRGKNNEAPSFVFSKIKKEDMMEFDQQTREKAIKMAAQLGIHCCINLNFIPACLQSTDRYILATQEAFKINGLHPNQLIIEILEEGIIHDHQQFSIHINKFRSKGIKVAIDDFGAGYSGLNLLVNFQPDIIKLDMQLIHNIDLHGPRQAVVKALLDICTRLGIDLIAEGVETLGEYQWLKKNGIFLFQGYLFAKPGFECLPVVNYPD